MIVVLKVRLTEMSVSQKTKVAVLRLPKTKKSANQKTKVVILKFQNHQGLLPLSSFSEEDDLQPLSRVAKGKQRERTPETKGTKNKQLTVLATPSSNPSPYNRQRRARASKPKEPTLTPGGKAAKKATEGNRPPPCGAPAAWANVSVYLSLFIRN